MKKRVKNKFENGLYVTATPIGNLGDITLRAIDLLHEADFIACEDKRVSGKLLSYYDIKTPMISYHDHNAQDVMPKLINELQDGKIIALISDAGTPLISDPGYRLVNECQKEGILVTSLPGASAILCALTNAGLPTNNFLFQGFLPPKTQARQKEIGKFSTVDASLVYYESPKRLLACLKDILSVLGDREIAVCRELTKLYEETRKDKISNLIELYENKPTPKGEIVIVVSPPNKNEGQIDDLDAALKDALKTLSVKEAVAGVTYMTGKKRKEVYKRALEISKDDER
jgi:16S rRNA (cytidine1402-2'-O)-methyltransferase